MPVDHVPRREGKLNQRQRLELLAGELPELLGLSQEMGSLAKEAFEDLTALRSFLGDTVYGAVPRERLFFEYLEAKIVLLHSFCTNVIFAMLLRAEGHNIRAHPVMKQLLEHQYTMRDMKRMDKFWQEETELLLDLQGSLSKASKGSKGKAAANQAITKMRQTRPGHAKGGGDGDADSETDEEGRNYHEEEEDHVELSPTPGVKSNPHSGINIEEEDGSEDSEVDSEEERREEEEIFNHFGTTDSPKKAKVKRQRGVFASLGSDFAEYEEEEEEALGLSNSTRNGKGADLKQALQGFAQAQRKASREKGKVGLDDQLASLDKAPKKKKGDSDSSSSDDDVEEEEEEDGEDNEEQEREGAPQYSQDQLDAVRALLQGVPQPVTERKRRRAPDEKMDEEADLGGEGESESDTGDADLLESFTAAKKKFIATKKLHYTPAPRYGGIEQSVGDGEKRGASYEIIKNKGLTPHRKKANRNPRVKKRQMYAKAVVARKGQVREVVEHSGNYGGETTGIKANISKGRKINT